jgi:AhpD family alkylhydroperoxidase
MPRVQGAKLSEVADDIRRVFERQQQRYGKVLYNHTVLARRPAVFWGFRALWDGLEKDALLPARLVDLVNLKVASLVGCELCVEVNSALSRADGVSDAELDALSSYNSAPLFSEKERAALRYAEAVAIQRDVPDEVFEPLLVHFSEDEIVELTAAITFEICVAKFNRALQIEAPGVCRVAKL